MNPTTLAVAAVLGALVGTAAGASVIATNPGTPSAPATVCPAADELARTISDQFSITATVSTAPNPYNTQGRSVITMIPNWDSPSGVALGDQVSGAGREDDRAEYVLWNSTYWPHGAQTGTQMEDRGNPTQNHQDHVTIVVAAAKCNRTGATR